MQIFNKEMLPKVRTVKSAKELLEIAKATGVEITPEETATYFQQLNPKGGELFNVELDGVAGGGCASNLPLYIDYSMVQAFLHKLFSRISCLPMQSNAF